jgi:hypothetical protein
MFGDAAVAVHPQRAGSASNCQERQQRDDTAVSGAKVVSRGPVAVCWRAPETSVQVGAQLSAPVRAYFYTQQHWQRIIGNV